jgi:hypothetical protein
VSAVGHPGDAPLGEPVGSVPARLGVALVLAYRWTLGLFVPAGTCKFHPSCSQYAILALRRHGLLKGSALAASRLLRCHPWSKGGVDYP